MPPLLVRWWISPAERLVGVVGPDLLPEALRELRECEDVRSCGVEVLVSVGEFPLDVVQEPIELGAKGLGVGWS
jgi:hypothetical protein